MFKKIQSKLYLYCHSIQSKSTVIAAVSQNAILKCPVSERPHQLSLKIILAHVTPLRVIHCDENKGGYVNRTNLWQWFSLCSPSAWRTIALTSSIRGVTFVICM